MCLLQNIRIVLCRPIYGGNIGSVCRAMANMGLSDLALAGAGSFDREEARKMACWAADKDGYLCAKMEVAFA